MRGDGALSILQVLCSLQVHDHDLLLPNEQVTSYSMDEPSGDRGFRFSLSVSGVYVRTWA